MNARRLSVASASDTEGRAARLTPMADAAATTPEIRLMLLDGFELRCCGEPFSLPMAAQRVVCFLALRHQPLHRAFVAGSLWFGGSESDAQASLRSALWRVRHDCSAPVVCASRTHVQLAPHVTVDVREQITAAHQALDRSIGLDAIDLHVLEGELLPDWYDDWIVFERERLRQLRLHALESVALQLCEDGRYGDAVEAIFAALRGDELRESAHRNLIRIHLAEGNRAEAVRDLERYRHSVRGLGIDPSPELEALVRAAPSALEA